MGLKTLRHLLCMTVLFLFVVACSDYNEASTIKNSTEGQLDKKALADAAFLVNYSNYASVYTPDRSTKFAAISSNGKVLDVTPWLSGKGAIRMAEDQNNGYISFNRGTARYQVNLKSGAIQNLNPPKYNQSISFAMDSSTQSNYVVYDYAQSESKSQEMIYFNKKDLKKKVLKLPKGTGFLNSCLLTSNPKVNYCATSHSEMRDYLHKIDLKNGKVLQTMKLPHLKHRSLVTGGVGNLKIGELNGKLYFPYEHQFDKPYKSELIVVDPKKMKTKKIMEVPQKNFTPKSLFTYKGVLHLWSEYGFYTVNQDGKFNKIEMKFSKQHKKFLKKNDGMIREVRYVGDKAFVLIEYMDVSHETGEIDEVDLKTGKIIRKTVLDFKESGEMMGKLSFLILHKKNKS
ncbi:hypothetical protein A374_16378 [Fictibacillus macauensis ZFHKF-1]|uniref:Lipoprotein n=1 Tax=Fictibacillus macauensis ZFHKF-1 TaxID=1196324 RepID=I8UBQ7_9BACL|nr:hypothetical protein [Fictibacillus macauensis]EIT84380.1 hypothetical protein A374_16378 [Fictibacillus macauensis ZFHKF-1]